MKKDKNDIKKLSNEEDEVKHLLSEPEVPYKKMVFKMFNSFEEMNEANARAMVQLSGEEHLQIATELTKRIFDEELKKPMNKRIQFKK